MDGFDGGKIGDELTLSIEFNANPGPDEIKWYISYNNLIIYFWNYYAAVCLL